jgi:opacity protein-like surface antigen
MSVALLAGMTAVCGATLASAADMPPITGVYQAAPIVQEFGSGWYLRGDIGWRTNAKIGDITSRAALPTNYSINDIASGGVGGGYKAGWFRSDVTVDYAGRTKFVGDGVLPGAFSGQIETLTALANLYVDLGSWSGFTPYVGVGAGVAVSRTYNYLPPAGIITVDYQTHTDFAWAYMAGLSWCINPKWLVDLSFRRLNFGEVTFNPLLQNALTLKDLSANEFRIGLRYVID